MKIYNVIIEDRHTDVEVESYSDQNSAVTRAKFVAKDCSKRSEDYEEIDIGGWLFYAVYSCEGDSVRVVETKLKGG